MYKNVEDRRAANLRSYHKNKDKQIYWQKVRREKLRQQLAEYKATLSCTTCGESDPVVLQFHHHNDDKKHSVSRLLQKASAWETIMKEIAKCTVLCANCHLRLHVGEAKR